VPAYAHPAGAPSHRSSGSCATSAATSTTTSFSDHPRRRSSWSTPTLTGPIVPTRAGPLPVLPCSWAPTSSPGLPCGSSSSPAPAPRSSIALWPMVWQRPPRCASYYTSSTSLFSAQPSSLAAMSVRSTSPPTPCIISARSMWRSTCSSSASVSLPVTFGFSASPPRCNTTTSSPRGYRRVYF
jgi:hypothetical protein